MKYTITSIICIICLTIFYFDACSNYEVVKVKDLNAFKAEVRAEFDRVQDNIDSLKNDVRKLDSRFDTLSNNIDTLKAGQEVIYHEIKQQSESSWLQAIKNFVK